MPPVLVAPDAFASTLRAAQVAGALARGLEAGGWEVDPCPLAGGGVGTGEVLLLGLGGETACATLSEPDGGERRVGFALLEGGALAVVEAAAALAPGSAARDSTCVGELLLAAAGAEAGLIVLAAAGAPSGDEGAGAAEAIGAAGGLGGARVVVLGEGRAGGGGLAAPLAAALDARLESGPSFVLDALDYDVRMRASRCVVVGAARLDDGALRGGVLAEAATRARQSGVPCHAAVATNALDRFGARILDLQAIREASTIEELERAGRELAELI